MRRSGKSNRKARRSHKRVKQSRQDKLPDAQVPVARYLMAMMAGRGDKQAAARYAAEHWPSHPDIAKAVAEGKPTFEMSKGYIDLWRQELTERNKQRMEFPGPLD